MATKRLHILAVFLLSGALAPEPSAAHTGAVDALGCHSDRQRGEYHCHEGALAGRAFASSDEARQALAADQPPRDTSESAADSGSIDAAPPVAVPFDRVLYTHWVDADADCQDTRQEVLISQSLVPPILDTRGCRVVSGHWFDLYTGQIHTDPRFLDIDHFIPLAEVHRSGGDGWEPEERRAYANDIFHANTLLAVSASANRAKADRDPAEWLPPNESYRCDYVRTWVVLKATWGLLMDAEEQAAVKRVLQACL